MINEFWDDNEWPLAYLITFRTFGTWVHGDERGAVDRHGQNIYGTPKVLHNKDLIRLMTVNQSQPEFILDKPRRTIVEQAIKNVCRFRNYTLFAGNVRSNHAHAVVGAAVVPNTILNAFKANATRELRESGTVGVEQKIWSRGGSTRYLWRPAHLDRAVDYILFGQGDDIPDFI